MRSPGRTVVRSPAYPIEPAINGGRKPSCVFVENGGARPAPAKPPNRLPCRAPRRTGWPSAGLLDQRATTSWSRFLLTKKDRQWGRPPPTEVGGKSCPAQAGRIGISGRS
jgi:hypothetical protein